MRNLKNVTLVAVATQDSAAAIAALEYSQRELNFSDVLFISNKNILGQQCPFRYIEVAPFKNVSEWGEFIVFNLHKYIFTDHIILIHEDGFIVNPEAWDDSWLNYDYVGAPFPYPKDDFSFRDQSGSIVRVGNSVSLRSSRLLKLPSKIGLKWKDFDGGFAHEDGYLCVQHRNTLEHHGIKFAPFNVALRFGREVNLPEHQGIKPFTFHTWRGPNKAYPCFNSRSNMKKRLLRIVKKIFKGLRLWQK